MFNLFKQLQSSFQPQKQKIICDFNHTCAAPVVSGVSQGSFLDLYFIIYLLVTFLLNRATISFLCTYFLRTLRGFFLTFSCWNKQDD